MPKIFSLYKILLKEHGDPEKLWPDWCSKNKNVKLRELIALGAILTQRTSWRNADIALRNLLKVDLLSLEIIAGISDLTKLTDLIRPAGFYTTKPKRLHAFSSFVMNNYGGLERMISEDTKLVREKLLKVYGIGPETADTLLLYALDKPSFVIDEYTKRFVKKYELSVETDNYDSLKEMFERSLTKDTTLFQNYHALMIVDAKGKKWSKMEKIA